MVLECNNPTTGVSSSSLDSNMKVKEEPGEVINTINPNMNLNQLNQLNMECWLLSLWSSGVLKWRAKTLVRANTLHSEFVLQ